MCARHRQNICNCCATMMEFPMSVGKRSDHPQKCGSSGRVRPFHLITGHGPLSLVRPYHCQALTGLNQTAGSKDSCFFSHLVFRSPPLSWGCSLTSIFGFSSTLILNDEPELVGNKKFHRCFNDLSLQTIRSIRHKTSRFWCLVDSSKSCRWCLLSVLCFPLSPLSTPTPCSTSQH